VLSIVPDIFPPSVRALFTGKEPGLQVAGLLGAGRIYFPLQRHTAQVLHLERADEPPQVADAVITALRDVALGLKVADCVPVLLYDPAHEVIGAVHAGWKGTARGLLRRTLGLMRECFGTRARDVLMALGPAIRWCCYQVGEDVLQAVREATGQGRYWLSRQGRLCLDLPEANILQALGEGLRREHIWQAQECTYCMKELYSYRRDKTGQRQGGFIMLKGGGAS
jgi:hypothetical protein